MRKNDKQPLVQDAPPAPPGQLGALGLQSGSRHAPGSDRALAAVPDVRPQASPYDEYVASGPVLYLQNALRSLPFFVDDITADFGDDLYRRMMQDPQIAFCINLLKMAILANPLRLTPAVPEERVDPKTGEATPHPDYELASEICGFCERCLTNLRTPLYDVLWSLLDAVAYGNKVAELIYEPRPDGADGPRVRLTDIKSKPRRSVAFVVDAFSNVRGLFGIRPGQGVPSPLQAVFTPSTALLPILPRRKFAVFTFRPEDCDPRGTSVLRPAYNSWNIKMGLYGEYVKFLTQFGGPAIIAEMPEGAQPVARQKADGTLATGPDGEILYDNPADAMLASLSNIASGTVAVIPHGAKANPLEMTGAGEAYLSAFELLNREIAKSILCQTLATEEAQHQARASSETHADSLAIVYMDGKTRIETVIDRDLVAPLVDYNWDGCEHLRPKASLSDTQGQNFAAYATAVAALMRSGYLDPSQAAGIDAMLNLPKRFPRPDDGLTAPPKADKQSNGDPPKSKGDPTQTDDSGDDDE